MLEDLKLLLGISSDDTTLDDTLDVILTATRKRLKALLGGLDPPDEMDYIVTEVSVIRYNRLGSEGLTAHTVEGETQTFSENDFAAYMDDIQTWLSSQKSVTKGRVRFL